MESKSDISGPFSRACKIADIPAPGLKARLEAEESERAAITGVLDLLALGSLRMDYEIYHSGGNRFRLKGRLHASVTQRCVVTLEPVESAIDEMIELQFWPEEDVAALERRPDEEAMAVSLEGPEPIVNGVIDIGHLAYEYLAAAIEPYPRKPGASFEWHDPRSTDAPGIADKPFAELARLIRPKDAR